MGLIHQAIQLFRGGIGGAERREHAFGFVVYRSAGCACSAKAITLLREQGVEPVIRELEDHPEIRRQHGAGTPIVFVDGRLRFFGRVDWVPLQRLLANQRRASNRAVDR